MKYNIKQLNLFVIFLTVAGNVSAGKIYKWIDEQGKVHYSNNAQFAKPKGIIKSLDVKGVKKNKRKRSKGLSGKWFSEYRNNKYELKFINNTVSYREGKYGGWLFNGKVKRENANLHITYHLNHYNQVEIGKSETYKIISLTDGELVLLFPDNSVKSFYRFTDARFKNKSDYSLLNGEWKNLESQAVLEIIGSRFNIKEAEESRDYIATQAYISSQGELNKIDKTLKFRYIGRKNYKYKIGSKKDYKIIYLGKRNFTLQNTTTGKIIKYEKILLE